MALENAPNTAPITGTLTTNGDVSATFTVIRASSSQDRAGFDLSLLGVTADTVILERRIGPEQTMWGPMESFTTNAERSVCQYTSKAEYRLRKTGATDTVSFIMAK